MSRFRFTIVSLGAVSLSPSFIHLTSHSESKPNSKNHSLLSSPLSLKCESPSKLGIKDLIGCGMRKKFFLDIYMASMYVDGETSRRLTSKLNTTSILSEALLDDRGRTNTSLVLFFRRNVSKSTFIDAMLQAFDGFSTNETTALKRFFESVIGDNIKMSDRLEISWLKEGGILMKKNDESPMCLEFTQEAYARLLQIYCDPKRTVVPDLIVSVNETVRSK